MGKENMKQETNLVEEENQRCLFEKFVLADLSPKRNRILLKYHQNRIRDVIL